MKFLPGFNLLDDAFSNLVDDSFVSNRHTNMKTDVYEKDGNYVLDMELAGYKKEDIQLSLKDGYLNISASSNTSNEEKDDKGNIIKQERYSGSCSRSFFVGKGVKQEDIKAEFKNGELNIMIPKKELKQEEDSKFIPIR